MTQEEKQIIMTKEEKDLLVKDLCARFPYDTMISVNDGKYRKDVKLHPHYIFDWDADRCDAKPYLRKMSTMTEEERSELRIIWHEDFAGDSSLSSENLGIAAIYTCHPKTTDFYLSHYFDYRGLIEKGLALEAPKEMYNF